jgi:aryl-alcohol dehydrogenase-like predicted oxidoreductase
VQGEYIVSIAGTKYIKHLEDNACSANVSLTKEKLELLDKIAPGNFAKNYVFRKTLWAQLTVRYY